MGTGTIGTVTKNGDVLTYKTPGGYSINYDTTAKS